MNSSGKGQETPSSDPHKKADAENEDTLSIIYLVICKYLK